MSDKLQRTIARFQERIDNKDYYEAHQTLRTITNRYVKAKQFDLAIGILRQGASILASNKEYASASDLVSYLIQVYTEAGVACSASGPGHEYRAALIELVSLLPDTDPSIGDLAKQALAWAQLDGTSKFGDASLHHVFGTKLLAAVPEQATDADKYKVFAVAELHLILGTFESLPVYVDYLFCWYLENKRTADAGEFLARAVVNYAYLKNIKFAQAATDRFLQKLIDLTQPALEKTDSLYVFEAHDLLNFLQLLVATLKKEHAGEKFMKLYGHYESLLAQNDLVAPVQYLGREYFGLSLGSAQGGNNMLANLMGSFFK
ncbi:DUF410-domain-containing protein [Metschnikowia bicuspidata var. bicuspidata NRRL YB-4993]|uniref:DUF410-domain-containing protein n=1 Tax=Metschnikowia bicuspidata var. bicuspidata NRRL YB-4993 TaxID=869754 RepID=A0A1A0HDJ2_9ASCO|nr:DUF410-domain-containing protein [Metschnikowia bicuspidata var. bicuspidata NRRL YB-4993]OBA22154.1 DUF410-domain-containing protein [Metschnikowia bicuspidata var. bicuspidata NRRL YB-4993]